MTTSAQRMRALRSRQRAKGYVEVTVWVPPVAVPRLRKYVKELASDRGVTLRGVGK